MKYGIAIWNYSWDAAALPGWIHEFADHGFDAISLNLHQFAGGLPRHLQAAVDALRSRNLIATVHGACAMDRELIKTMVHSLGESLYAITLDSAMYEDSRGRFHDAKRIAEVLACLQNLTARSTVKLAIEDFPLDARALKHFAPDLGAVYDHPRTGILIDVGHMHMRRTREEYFRRMSVSEYFRALPCPLVEVHLHDNNGDKDQHGHFGSGTVPFAEIAQSLKDLRFDGVCTIEIAPGFHGSTPQQSKGKAVESLALWRMLIQGDGRSAKHTPDGICQPADGAPKPSA